jgi:hypothetical protein
MIDVIVGALKSKTIWVAVAGILVSALYAPVQVWIAAHPGLAGTVAGLVMAALRTITTSSLAAKVTTTAK